MYQKIIKFSLYSLVFLLPLFFLPFSFEAFEFNKQYLLFFLVSVAFLAWLAKIILIDKEVRLKHSFLDFFVLGFLLVGVLSAVFSVSRNSSLFGFYGRFSDSLIGLLSLGALYFLITNNVGAETTADELPLVVDKKKSEKISHKSASISGILRIFLWSVFFVVLLSYFSIFGVWQKASQLVVLPFVVQQETFSPAGGSLENLAMFLAGVVALLTGIALAEKKEKKEKAGGKSGKLKEAGVYFLLLAVLGLLVIINFNPAWLAILFGLFLFLIFALWKRMFKEEINKLLLPIILVVLSFGFLFINVSGVQRLVLGYYLPREEVLGQGISWTVGLKSAIENVKSAFLGSGIGTFHYGFARFKPAAFNQSPFWYVRFDRPGSHLAEVLGTMGFLGLLSYLALLGMFFFVNFLFLQKKKGGMVLVITFLVLLAGQFVFYQNTVLAFAFWLFLALSVVSWHSPDKEGPLKEKVISFKEFPELSLVFSVLLTVFGLAVLVAYFFGARFYLADANYRNYFITGNREKLEKAAELNPSSSQYKMVLSRDYLGRIIEEGQKPAGQIDETAVSNNIYFAIAFAKEATELSPNRVAVWENLAVVYREIQGVAVGATEWGIKSLERAIVLEPTNPVLQTELGKFYLFAGEIELARERFGRAKELMPDYIEASIQLAFIHEFEQDIEEAIRQMEDLVSFYPYNLEAIFQLGRLYLNDNQTDEAISQFEWAVELFPNYSNALYSLGLAYQGKGQREKAISAFERVLELNPGNEDVIQKLREARGEKVREEIIEKEIIEEED